MNKKHTNKIIFISGGSRSGKSRYAEQRAELITGKRSYIATCPTIDAEMDSRIALHQQRRSGKGWLTVEEPLDLAQALIDSADSTVVLVDCLTLWVNNLLYEADCQDQPLSEENILRSCQQVLDACTAGDRTIIFVTNELGMGIVPADAISRLYRDLVGRCNQTFAAQADEVVLLVSGLPLFLKGSSPS